MTCSRARSGGLFSSRLGAVLKMKWLNSSIWRVLRGGYKTPCCADRVAVVFGESTEVPKFEGVEGFRPTEAGEGAVVADLAPVRVAAAGGLGRRVAGTEDDRVVRDGGDRYTQTLDVVEQLAHVGRASLH